MRGTIKKVLLAVSLLLAVALLMTGCNLMRTIAGSNDDGGTDGGSVMGSGNDSNTGDPPQQELPDAVTLFRNALAMQTDLDEYDLSLTASISAEEDGETFAVDMVSTIKATGIKSPDTTVMLVDIDMTAIDQSMQMSVYYADGWMYMEMMGMKAKQRSSPDDVNDLTGEMQVDFNLTDQMFESAKVAATAGGGYIVTIDTLDDDIPEEVLESFFESMAGGEDDIRFDSTTIVLTFRADGFLTSQKVTANFFDPAGSGIGSMKYDMLFLATENVVITPPADLDSYMETDY